MNEAPRPVHGPLAKESIEQRLPQTLEEVILQEQQGECFLLDTGSGEVYSVNPTAARIFSLCRSGATFKEAVRDLLSGLQPPLMEAEVLDDVCSTVQRFQQLGICAPPRAG